MAPLWDGPSSASSPASTRPPTLRSPIPPSRRHWRAACRGRDPKPSSSSPPRAHRSADEFRRWILAQLKVTRLLDAGFPLTQVASLPSSAGHFRPSRARANRPKSRDKRWGSPRRISSRRWTSRPSSASTWCVRRLAPTGHRLRLPRFPSRDLPAAPLRAAARSRTDAHLARARIRPTTTLRRQRARNGATP